MEDILNPEYWNARLESAKRVNQIHQSVYLCGKALWDRIEENHKSILNKIIKPCDTLLDVGCGYGRLLKMLPKHRNYTGIDISNDLVNIAKNNNSDDTKASFVCYREGIKGYLETFPNLKFDWAILVSFKPMIIRNCGEDYWNQIHSLLLRDCKQILYLEYDINDKGTIEKGNYNEYQ